VIFDCIATEKTIDDDIHLVRSNGKIIFVGLGSTTTKKVDWSVQAYKEISLTGAMMYGIENINGEKKDDFELALEMLSKEPDKFKGFVTHKFPIDQFKYVMN
jgi:threonine dehydrogenase-like Zn-dependent dehydrogenase